MYGLGGEGEGVVSAIAGRVRGVGMKALGMVPGVRELIMKQAS